jgi:hypothetical protein
LLARLRLASAIDVHHPSSMTREEVHAAWSAFLAAGSRRHWPWFLVNAAIAPLTILLIPVPGPNLIGYWFTYRALHHLFILYGLSRARRGRVVTHLLSTEVLDVTIARVGDPEDPDPGRAADHNVAHLALLGCDPGGVREFLRRQCSRSTLRSKASSTAGR